MGLELPGRVPQIRTRRTVATLHHVPTGIGWKTPDKLPSAPRTPRQRDPRVWIDGKKVDWQVKSPRATPARRSHFPRGRASPSLSSPERAIWKMGLWGSIAPPVPQIDIPVLEFDLDRLASAGYRALLPGGARTWHSNRKRRSANGSSDRLAGRPARQDSGPNCRHVDSMCRGIAPWPNMRRKRNGSLPLAAATIRRLRAPMLPLPATMCWAIGSPRRRPPSDFKPSVDRVALAALGNHRTLDCSRGKDAFRF